MTNKPTLTELVAEILSSNDPNILTRNWWASTIEAAQAEHEAELLAFAAWAYDRCDLCDCDEICKHDLAAFREQQKDGEPNGS